MAFAVMMVHVDLDDSQPRVRLAAQLARRFGSTLIGVSAALVEEDRTAIKTLLDRRRETFHSLAGEVGVKFDWRSANQVPDDFVAREARAADLLIIGRVPAAGGVTRALEPGPVVLRAGRPALIVPPDMEVVRAERILIAWKDTREARRAVNDALPLLHEAKHVNVVEIQGIDGDRRAQGRVDDVAHYLMCHRITASTHVLAQDGRKLAEILVDVARNDGADLIVAGAYGHSRLDEWVFGGVTRDLLTACPMCCLLAH
jgi:nucleotide-binding universal stress UspA family protein